MREAAYLVIRRAKGQDGRPAGAMTHAPIIVCDDGTEVEIKFSQGFEFVMDAVGDPGQVKLKLTAMNVVFEEA